MIQLSDVRVFLEIVSAGSFTGAGRSLRLPKSSIARQLARLEISTGCALLKRTSRSVTLTEEGRAFLPYARRLLDDSIEAENVLRAKGNGAGGLVTVSATPLIGRRFLIPFLPRFFAAHRKVRVALWLTPARMEVGSSPGEVDVAIRLRSVAAPDIGTRKLGEIAFAVVAAPQYLAARGVPRVPADLSRHELIELGPPGKSHVMQLACGRDVSQVRYTPLLHIDDPEAVFAATLAGIGISALPSFLVAEALRAGQLVHVMKEWAPPPVPLHLLHANNVAPPLRVRALIDFLVEAVSDTHLHGDLA